MAGIRTENKIYEVGIYCRLSKDDGTDNESASIATQKSILTDYVKRQGWHLAKTYVDDGYSGTNFQRPSFQNMIKDIENGLINCVITKDLSRLGRNYLDCGLYLEVFFPEHNVRYIAVNDGVDTLNKSAMDITPFRNILNEMYSADVSVKIKSAYRARFQQGKFMGTTAPYGYVKDPADHNHLLIDDKVAHVVREIFDLALAGNGIAKIRKHINKQHILRPAAYAVEQGATGYERYFEDNEENRYIWSENSVRGILRSPIYAGNLAGYKRIAANMKSKKRPSKLPEEWEVIPDTHEGIVTQEEFDTVQQLMTSRRREQNAGGFENIFSGVIKCADCGYAMRAASANRRKRPDIIDCVQYTCNNYGRYGNVMCTAHSIEARDLFNAVLADINRFADMAVNDEKAVRAIERRLTETDQSRAKSLEKEKKKLNKRLAELDRLFSSLYEDKVMERITERNFEMMSGKYQKEQLEIEARLKEVTETLNDSYEKSQGVRDFLSLIRNYQGIKELDATIINALIDKILVSEREKLTDGTVRQEIKIYYKFIGFVGELHITPTKRWTALKPKNCTVCGVEYVPSSGISKYCPACAKRIQREKSNESKRRSRERNRRACIELSAKNDRLIAASCGELGIDISQALRVPGGSTSTYLYLNGPDGDMALAVSDMDICRKMTPQFLASRLTLLKGAQLIVADANLPAESLRFLADHGAAPLFVDPVSTVKAEKLRPILGKIHTLKPNRMEAELLSGVAITNEESLRQAAQVLLDTGLRRVFISLGSRGLFAADHRESLLLPCRPAAPVNATGAGDAFMAGLAWAYLEGTDLRGTALAGASAGAIAIEGSETINPALSPEVLRARMDR